MSCLYSCSTGRSDVNLVEQVLEQGQRLRNSMVQSILSNDPFYKEALEPRRPCRMHSINMDEEREKLSIQAPDIVKPLSLAEKHKFVKYLRGDDMSCEEEKQALDTFRAMSNTDICEVTAKSYSTLQNNCNCDTCKAYYRYDFNTTTTQPVPPLNLKTSNREMNDQNHLLCYLKYVDTLKIAVHSFKLSPEGNRKVSSSFTDVKNLRYPQNLTTTYFLEYEIPACISKKSVAKKAKVDTGLEASNVVKLCSKKLHHEVIYFKQISIHDVCNLHSQNLDAIEITFRVSCRSHRQKGVNVMGTAKFNMSSFARTQYFSCNQELVVYLAGDAPIVIGTIKISLQLGCGRIYYGKEFVDSISQDVGGNVELPEVVSYDISYEHDGVSCESLLTGNKSVLVEKLDENIESCKRNDFEKKRSEDTLIRQEYTEKGKMKESHHMSKRQENVQKESLISRLQEIDDRSKGKERKAVVKTPKLSQKPDCKENSARDIPQQIQQSIEPPVLFGFIYISEVEFLGNKESTFVTCKPFSQNESIYSNPVNGGSNPIYNFHQKIPVVYEEDFISKLRDNFMIFEFWERQSNNRETLIGVCKISLHQYYLAFRNPVIVKYLDRNKLPVIGTDWYEPISDLVTGEITGQVQILIALGSETQVHNLEQERGFRDNIVTKAKRIIAQPKPPFLLEQLDHRKVAHNPNKQCLSTPIGPNNFKITPVITDKQIIPTDTQTVPIHNTQQIIPTNEQIIQSDVQITPVQNTIEPSKVLNVHFDSNTKQDVVIKVSKSTSTESLTERNVPVLKLDKSTNKTDIIDKSSQTDMDPPKSAINSENENNFRKTSDLLDSLSKALTIDTNCVEADTFKAHIFVESALHLPSRKKCKAKKLRGKLVREEILPSTYVTFETGSAGRLKVTQVVQKSTSPKWDFRCDVTLLTELLTNNQKRLIFKVWKKGNNASTQPNMDVDSVVGFAALDLTVLLAGLPTVQGWFNIVDFTSKCNGQIKINVTPLENISRYSSHKSTTQSTPTNETPSISSPPQPQLNLDEPGELLNRALKRKFVELDEITQRLRSRLSNVTNNEESDVSNDDTDEFERDINTLCVEDDYETVDFVREAQDLNMQMVSNSLHRWQGTSPDDSQALLMSSECSSVTSVTTLDQHLVEGKQRIDSLLQKLSLISKSEHEPFSNRYVSGCSVSQEIDTVSSRSTQEDIMNELGIDISKSFDTSSLQEQLENSCRDAPDGAGNASDKDKI